MADYLLELDRYEEALSLITIVEGFQDNEPAIRAACSTQRALLAAASGKTLEATDYFERAVKIAKEGSSIFQLVDIFSVYSESLKNLGNIELAKACLEHAILVAREYNIVWRISTLCSVYANMLLIMGQYTMAHKYLLESFVYDAQGPLIEAWRARNGIPIALYLNDDSILAKCARPAALEFALRSGEVVLFAQTAAAFAQLYAKQGQVNKAQTLLHRAVGIINKTDGIWDFSVTVARFGQLQDALLLQKLLEKGLRGPSPELTEAFLEIFNAFMAKRKGFEPDSQAHARKAVKQFAALGWYAYVDLAYTLLPGSMNSTVDSRDYKPFASILSALTQREQQVGELVLKGYTNRAIAVELSIKERTVEAHMTAIMRHLGIRSRHQLGITESRDL